jgi:hypothetical protein
LHLSRPKQRRLTFPRHRLVPPYRRARSTESRRAQPRRSSGSSCSSRSPRSALLPGCGRKGVARDCPLCLLGSHLVDKSLRADRFCWPGLAVTLIGSAVLASGCGGGSPRSGRHQSASDVDYDRAVGRTEREQDRPGQPCPRLRPVHAQPRRAELPRSCPRGGQRARDDHPGSGVDPNSPRSRLRGTHASTCCRIAASPSPPRGARSPLPSRLTTSRPPPACARTEFRTSPTRPSRTTRSRSTARRRSTRTLPSTRER